MDTSDQSNEDASTIENIVEKLAKACREGKLEIITEEENKTLARTYTWISLTRFDYGHVEPRNIILYGNGYKYYYVCAKDKFKCSNKPVCQRLFTTTDGKSDVGLVEGIVPVMYGHNDECICKTNGTRVLNKHELQALNVILSHHFENFTDSSTYSIRTDAADFSSIQTAFASDFVVPSAECRDALNWSETSCDNADEENELRGPEFMASLKKTLQNVRKKLRLHKKREKSVPGSPSNKGLRENNLQTEKVQSENNCKNDKDTKYYPLRARQVKHEKAGSKSVKVSANDDEGAITNDVKCDAKKSKKSKPYEIDTNCNIFEYAKEDSSSYNQWSICCIEPATDFDTKSGSKLRFIKPIGQGGFSLVWLAYDLINKMFKAVKVFKTKRSIRDKEIMVLQQFYDHPHILKFYEPFTFHNFKRLTYFAVYEPLGKDLQVMIHEAAKNGEYFSMDVIKRVTKHMLLALEALHKFEIDGKKIIHSDIKPSNIVVCTSQRNLSLQLENFVDMRGSIKQLRMACNENLKFSHTKFTEEEVLPRLKECVNNGSEEEELNGLTFKLIDFGNVLKEGEHRTTGTYGYCPPEYYIGLPLSYSHDIWSLGVVLIHMLTCRRFIPLRKVGQTELEVFVNLFGKFPREVYTDLKLPDDYEKKFTKENSNTENFKVRFNTVLQKKIETYQMYEQMSVDDRQELMSILTNMITYKPKRKTADELLTYSFLKDVV